MLEKFKHKWDIKSSKKLFLILAVFALTGSSAVVVQEYLLQYLPFTRDLKVAGKILLFILFTLPVYNILLLIWGSLLGQFRFFWNFEKKFFKRLIGKK